MTDVKPCPFCGTADVTMQPGSTFRWWVAACSSCGAQSGEVRVQTMGDGTPAEWAATGAALALAQWNARFP